MLAMREKRALLGGCRGSSQLAQMGKLKCERKHRSSVPDAFKGIVPDVHTFTCMSVFERALCVRSLSRFIPLPGSASELAATGAQQPRPLLPAGIPQVGGLNLRPRPKL